MSVEITQIDFNKSQLLSIQWILKLKGIFLFLMVWLHQQSLFRSQFQTCHSKSSILPVSKSNKVSEPDVFGLIFYRPQWLRSLILGSLDTRKDLSCFGNQAKSFGIEHRTTPLSPIPRRFSLKSTIWTDSVRWIQVSYLIWQRPSGFLTHTSRNGG